MKLVWQYPLVEEADNLLKVPKGAKFLSVAEQHNRLILYALVDPNKPRTEEWCVTTISTHLPIPDKILSGKFLGTVVTCGGALVWHCWRWNC